MATIDRKNALLELQTGPVPPMVTGIDFVAVRADQVTLDVFLFHDISAPVGAIRPLSPTLTINASDVTITGEDEPTIPVITATPVFPVEGREVLRVVVDHPGGFGRYWLTIEGSRIDPFFRKIQIDFKAACERNTDCKPPEHECPPDEPDDIVVDGSARDFWSLRQALIDFASLRHPKWKDRLIPDVGMTMLELIAALGDELAYYQDRVARETQFGSASQRRSVRRHVQLVDYDLHDGLGATGWVSVEVSSPNWENLPAGTPVWARGDGNTAIGFEVGEGLTDALGGRTFRVHQDRNKLSAHLWDGDVPDPEAAYRPLPFTCLPVGATSMHVDGHHAAFFSPGEKVFLITEPPSDERDAPERRLLVTLTDAADETDPLASLLGTSVDVTRISWSEPTPFEMNLEWTKVLGNAVPVTAGVTRSSIFSIGENTIDYPTAIERVGANQSIAFMHSLPTRGPGPTSPIVDDGIWQYVEDQQVVRLGPDPRTAAPEVEVYEVTSPTFARTQKWDFRPSFVGSNSSLPQDFHFVLDDGSWDRAIGFQRPGGEVVHRDYLTAIGSTVRFGDGEFGRMPPRGNATLGQEIFFEAIYRLGNGLRSNVAMGALRYADPTGTLDWTTLPTPIAYVTSMWNPLPTAGGVDAETIAQAKRDAPQAFQAITYRAVRPEDFEEAAERLSWVQRAGAKFRWTGSWSTAFVTADAKTVSLLPDDYQRALGVHLDRFRMAGREVHVLAPHYADLDLVITICVQPTSYPVDVVAAVTRALIGKNGVVREIGFFDPDNFTFGTTLDRSELEARIQNVPGVRAVKKITIARRGKFVERLLESFYAPGKDEVIRVDDDPRHPDRGTIAIHWEGGA